MVREVYGQCDGYQIIFRRRDDSDLWDAIVPFDRDGQYVVALYAVDYAGNESFYANVLFTVKRFCISVKILNVNTSVNTDLDLFKLEKACLYSTAQALRLVPGFRQISICVPRIMAYNVTAVRCEKCGGV